MPRRAVSSLTRRELVRPALHGWYSPDFERGRVPVTARYGTPLQHLFHRDGTRRLRIKGSGAELAVPLMRRDTHNDLPGHERLNCDACHAAWAPQCDGCHIGFDAGGRQWDHLEARPTPGRWIEARWSVRADPPALGVRADGRIGPFVPGMAVLMDLPGAARTRRHVRYARISPHTTSRRSRSCASCHRSDAALGLVTGEAVHPGKPDWRLPIGWVRTEARQPAPGLHPGDRSFNAAERARVRRVGGCLECHAGDAPLYRRFAESLARIGGTESHRRAHAAGKPGPAGPPGQPAPAGPPGHGITSPQRNPQP